MDCQQESLVEEQQKPLPQTNPLKKELSDANERIKDLEIKLDLMKLKLEAATKRERSLTKDLFELKKKQQKQKKKEAKNLKGETDKKSKYRNDTTVKEDNHMSIYDLNDVLQKFITTMSDSDNEDAATEALDALYHMDKQLHGSSSAKPGAFSLRESLSGSEQKLHDKLIISPPEEKSNNINDGETLINMYHQTKSKPQHAPPLPSPNSIFDFPKEVQVTDSFSSVNSSINFIDNHVCTKDELVKVCQNLMSERDQLIEEIINMRESSSRVNAAEYNAALAKARKELALATAKLQQQESTA